MHHPSKDTWFQMIKSGQHAVHNYRRIQHAVIRDQRSDGHDKSALDTSKGEIKDEFQSMTHHWMSSMDATT